LKKYSIEWWKSLTGPQIGNETEAMVEAVLKRWNSSVKFAWHRLPDTKAARMSMMAAQPADYIYRCGSYAGFIEVKALAHAYRLPKANLSQLPTLHKWELAGSDDVLLVFHYLTGEWRALDPRLLSTDVPSWNLSEYLVYPTAEEALKSLGYFR
jgi:hypothetical protein